MVRNHIIPMFIPHIGCPHQCVFCDQRRISGADQPVTPEQVRAALRAALPHCTGSAEAAFYGGSFTAMAPAYQQSLLNAVQPFLEDGSVSSIRISTRPDAVDAAALERLRRAGVRTIELGCQSMDPDVLRCSGRGHGREAVFHAAEAVRRGGFRMILQMMTGLPGDTEQSALRTARTLADLRPDGVRIYPTVVVRGTELHRRYLEGTYRPQTVEDATELCAKLLPIFLEAEIPILRIGLQATEELRAGGAVAGAYHPALGELVRSRVYRRRACELLSAQTGRTAVTLGVAPNRVSLMVGQKRCNLIWLQERFSITRIKVVAADVGDWQILLQSPPDISP